MCSGRDTRRSLDHSALHANLLRVQPLFAFCIDEGGEDNCGGRAGHGDGLAMVIFEMATRRSRSTGFLSEIIPLGFARG